MLVKIIFTFGMAAQFCIYRGKYQLAWADDNLLHNSATFYKHEDLNIFVNEI